MAQTQSLIPFKPKPAIRSPSVILPPALLALSSHVGPQTATLALRRDPAHFKGTDLANPIHPLDRADAPLPSGSPLAIL